MEHRDELVLRMRALRDKLDGMIDGERASPDEVLDVLEDAIQHIEGVARAEGLSDPKLQAEALSSSGLARG